MFPFLRVAASAIVFSTLFVAHAGRPLSTDDAATVSEGALEMEAGYQCAGKGKRCDNRAGEIVLVHGLTGRMDLALAVGYEEGDSDKGFSGAGCVAKYSLVRQKDGVADMSLSFASSLGSPGHVMNGIASWGRRSLAVHLNAGLAVDGNSTNRGRAVYGLAAEFALKQGLCLVGEVHGEEEDDGENSVELLCGAVFQLFGAASLDMGLANECAAGQDGVRYVCGVTAAL